MLKYYPFTKFHYANINKSRIPYLISALRYCYFENFSNLRPYLINIMQYTDKYRSPLGEITLASDGDHLTGLWFDGQKYFAATYRTEHQERELRYSS